jgi:monoamine oxidase
MGASPAFIQDMSESFGLGGGAESMSALSLLRDLASFFRERELTGGGRVKGGTDNFPRAIAAKLGARVLFGAKVRRVEQDATEARVTFFRRGELSRLRASRVVFALPFSLLRNIDIAPGLSEQKRLAVRDLKLESVTRIYAQAKRRFWIERGERGRADTDLPIGVVTDETERQVGQGGVLGAYLKDAIARRYAAMSAAERVAAVTGSIDRVHPGMKEQFVAGASKCWDDDPFALGAYAWFKPGQLVGFGALGEREGRLHFAGDHTSHRPGFMHGALASAKRVIGEIAGENSIGQSAPARH